MNFIASLFHQFFSVGSHIETAGPSRCIASVNGYLFYTSTSNFNVVHYNLSKVKAMNAGGLPPNPLPDTLNLQAVVDICTSPIIPDTLFYLQPHQIGKIVFSKQTETWTVTDDAETTWSDPTQAQTPNPTSPNSSSSQLPYLGSNRILGASQSGRILVGGRDEPRQRNYLCLYDPQTLLMSPDTPTFFEKTDRLQKLLVFEHRGLEFVCVLDHARHVHLCVLGAGEPNRTEGGDRGRGIKLLPGGIAVVAKVDTQQAGECFTGFWCANREEILLGGSEFRMVLKLQF